MQTADPGEKSQKGDPNADVNIDAPVGNADDKKWIYIFCKQPFIDKRHFKKIVKDGSIEFETNNLTATRKKILSSLKKYGGYVDEDNKTTNGDENRKEYE